MYCNNVRIKFGEVDYEEDNKVLEKCKSKKLERYSFEFFCT